MPAWVTRLREWVEFGFLRVVAAALAAIPLRLSSDFAAWSWGLVAPWLPRHERALEHLASAFPNMPAAERERIAREMWRNLGRTVAEFFHLKQILAEQRIDLEPPETFEALALTAPFVVCIPHLGNWEVAAQVGLRFGVPFAGVYQALTNPVVDRWLLEQRRPMYAGGLYPKSGETALMLRRLARRGVCPAFVADLREMAGVPATFFGRTAMSNPFPAFLAHVCNLPIYAACVVRKAGGRFEVHVTKVEVPHTGDRDADVLAATQSVQSAFEAFIRRWPEQWMWAHKRWG